MLNVQHSTLVCRKIAEILIRLTRDANRRAKARTGRISDLKLHLSLIHLSEDRERTKANEKQANFQKPGRAQTDSSSRHF
jgi:hypothetical protein